MFLNSTDVYNCQMASAKFFVYSLIITHSLKKLKKKTDLNTA